MGRYIFWRKIVILIFVITQATSLFADVYRRNPEDYFIQNQTKPLSLQGIDHPRTVKYLNKYGQGEGLEWVKRALKRAEPLLPFIQEEVEKNGIPPEVTYLPVIESAYRSIATSHAGAAGLWQFIPSTGTLFGLTINEWIDQRRDFYQATLSAMKTLKYNYAHTGDWLLALSAYNAGLGRIQRIIKENNSNDYWHLADIGALPIETRDYIPKLLAVSYIASHKMKYQIQPNWNTETNWTPIEVTKAIDLRILSEKSGASYKELKSLNSELSFHITPPIVKTYFLKVPKSYSSKINELLQNSTEMIPFNVYRIKSGDTLSEIADYYDITLGMLYQYNTGLNPRRLQLGQKILIPNLKDKPTYTGVIKSFASYKEVPGATYTVKAGDSLWSISQSRGISIEELRKINNLNTTNVIKIGWKLKVP
ncbi:LysM peptidoglycan-binding domain-containing protein [Spirochaeta cellobiosiphila]|uniref:LysM peptidoglycan-binding domain-containing protein n=1 Tax=Spirochaeta cellobiosiphila TaxID=504483 RepID=UPI000405122E|nr:LysM peptidoglycan-binding domain-containing protein [Spirochaeta cellobiosiphila]